MCLIVVARGLSSRYPLLVAANRDEDHGRPAAPAGWWDKPTILGGRDLVAGGTWLAVDRQGRLAAVTNAGVGAAPARRSRGHLVVDFLGTPEHARTATLPDPDLTHYAPFHLLLVDEEIRVVSNRDRSRSMADGIVTLSNGPLDGDWPKLAIARRGMEAALSAQDPVAALLELLLEGKQDLEQAARPEALDVEVRRRRIFIEGSRYGTRASTVVVIDGSGELRFVERRFDATGAVCGTTDVRFKLPPAARSAQASP